MNRHVHDEVLSAANDIVSRPGSGGVFTLLEIVQALPHLNEGTVRTHVGSRCCVNAPKNHPHKWDYFRRVSRKTYEVMPDYRRRGGAPVSAAPGSRSAEEGLVQAPSKPPTGGGGGQRDTIHAVIHTDAGIYTAECLEIAVVTEGHTLDEVARNVQEAIALHLEDEDMAALGLADHPRVQLIYETALAV